MASMARFLRKVHLLRGLVRVPQDVAQQAPDSHGGRVRTVTRSDADRVWSVRCQGLVNRKIPRFRLRLGLFLGVVPMKLQVPRFEPAGVGVNSIPNLILAEDTSASASNSICMPPF